MSSLISKLLNRTSCSFDKNKEIREDDCDDDPLIEVNEDIARMLQYRLHGRSKPEGRVRVDEANSQERSREQEGEDFMQPKQGAKERTGAHRDTYVDHLVNGDREKDTITLPLTPTLDRAKLLPGNIARMNNGGEPSKQFPSLADDVGLKLKILSVTTRVSNLPTWLSKLKSKVSRFIRNYMREEDIDDEFYMGPLDDESFRFICDKDIMNDVKEYTRNVDPRYEEKLSHTLHTNDYDNSRCAQIVRDLMVECSRNVLAYHGVTSRSDVGGKEILNPNMFHVYRITMEECLDTLIDSHICKQEVFTR